MVKIIFTAVMMTVLFACQEKPKNPVVIYGDTMITSYERGKQAGEAANLDSVKKALAAYHASNDKYPGTLDEIKPLFGPNLDISKYDYNPQNGTVTLKPR
jgi:hypothetical protein